MVITKKEIIQWCGKVIYDRGWDYYTANRVIELNLSGENTCHSQVRGEKIYDVFIDMKKNQVAAYCTCPAFQQKQRYCKHIAATMIGVQSQQEFSNPEPEKEIANALLSISNGLKTITEKKELIKTKYTMTLNKEKKNIEIGVAMGVKRTYKVNNIRDFLDSYGHFESYTISPSYEYQPEKQAFLQIDRNIIKILKQIRDLEQAYSGFSVNTVYLRKDRINVPSPLFSMLFPLLCQSKIDFYNGDQKFENISNGGEDIESPILLSEQKFDAEKIQQWTILKKYGYAIYKNLFYALESDVLYNLERIQELFRGYKKKMITLSDKQYPQLVQSLVPTLKTFIDVKDKKVNQSHLKPKFYIDAEDKILTVKVVFEYGEVKINPFGEHISNKNFFLIRDVQKEQKIMDLIQSAQYETKENKVHIKKDTEIYTFIRNILPQLRKIGEVWVTKAAAPIAEHPSPAFHTKMDISENRYFEIRFDIEGVEPKEVQQVLKSLLTEKRYHRLKTGEFLYLDEENFQQAKELLGETKIKTKNIHNGEVKTDLFQGMVYLSENKENRWVEISQAAKDFIVNMKEPGNLKFEIPTNLKATLRSYQKDGYRWFKTLSYYGFGGVLADDMGLGKTVQAITFMLSEKREEPMLVVCPTSVLYNWEKEIKKFAPDIEVVVLNGSSKERKEKWIQKQKEKTSTLYLTTYGLLRYDYLLFQKTTFHIIILDEAQNIKNHQTQTAQLAFKLKGRLRYALTGTPVENTLEDLWSLFHFVLPSLFPHHTDFKKLSNQEIAEKIKPFVLRRIKEKELDDLPEKKEIVKISELNKKQKLMYLAMLERTKKESENWIKEKGFRSSRIQILAALTRLRQISCHPKLIEKDYVGPSGKLKQMMGIIRQKQKQGKKMLIFSQFKEMLTIIEKELEKTNLSYYRIDGSTPSKKRLEMCETFNQGERDAFLVSLKAGGVGLNLTGANTVFLFDSWWNPAVEDQASDRAHRIGQTQTVEVIRMIAKGTIEEKIYELQQEKRDLFDQVIQTGKENEGKLTEEDIRSILQIS